MPIPFLIIAGIVVCSIIAATKRQQQAEARARQQRLAEEAKRQAAAQPAEGEATPQMRPGSGASDAERMRRQEELKRRLQENAARREAEKRASGSAAAPAQQRRPLEKRVMQTALQKEKPTVAHSDEDCGGGSIHDGYHEGVTQFASGRPAAVAGRLGQRLADEDERIEREKTSADAAKRAMERISKLPPLAQGMIYSEILGKPRSETA